jgi:hypothetical protein
MENVVDQQSTWKLLEENNHQKCNVVEAKQQN